MRYEIVIINKTDSENTESEETTAVPNEPKKTKEEKLIDKQIAKAKSLATGITISAATQVISNYVSLTGTQHLNDVMNFAQSSVSFAVSTIAATAAFGAVGLIGSFVSGAVGLIGKNIQYNNGKRWDEIEQNVNLRRAGTAFNLSRIGS